MDKSYTGPSSQSDARRTDSLMTSKATLSASWLLSHRASTISCFYGVIEARPSQFRGHPVTLVKPTTSSSIKTTAVTSQSGSISTTTVHSSCGFRLLYTTLDKIVLWTLDLACAAYDEWETCVQHNRSANFKLGFSICQKQTIGIEILSLLFWTPPPHTLVNRRFSPWYIKDIPFIFKSVLLLLLFLD